MMRSLLISLFFSFLPFTMVHADEWRGIMLDVSRHYMPVDFLQRQIDAMHHVGLNRLHLHLTDAAGWRIEIKRYPRLTSLGAWRTAWEWKTWWNDGHRAYADSTAFGGFYTQSQLRQLVAYAHERGVTIIPEIEFPAHSEEVVAAYPELGFNHAELNMDDPRVYAFMRDVLTEVASIFPSPYLHLGGDEAATQHDRQPQAMRRLNDIVRSLGRRMIVWDEALTSDPADSSMVIMVWRNADIARKALDLGHEVIMSPGAFCYLDKYQDAPATQPEAMGGYLSLQSMYEQLKSSRTLLASHPRLLGYQANLWTEYIPTPQYAEYMLWPRALCIADTQSPDYKSFRKQALKSISYLRDSLHINPFPLDREVGQRPEYDRPIHCLSTGRSVTYLSPYYEGYSAGGSQALTDGLRGGWSNTDGRWQGFIGRGRMNVVIDLEKVRTIHTVQADFMQNIGPEIFLPAQVLISSSTDGVHFTPLFTTSFPDSSLPVDFTTIAWHGKTRARYVQYQALNGSRGGWIFSDEVIIN